MKSIYRYAAEAGIPMGAWLSLTSFSLLLSLRLPALGLLTIPLVVGFPILLYLLMRRIARVEPLYRRFATLWLGGIYTVIFGTLICTLLSALWLTFADSGFIFHYVSNAISQIETLPDADAGGYGQAVDLMRRAIDARMLPTPLEFVSSMAWSTAFLGSMLSLLFAGLLVSGRPRPTC